jgi:hypothetical protein
MNKTGIKETAKRIFQLGKGSHKERNMQRTRFNNLLIDTYHGKQPVFDLARVESTWPDGQRQFSSVKSEQIYSLVPDYTYDGGHLSDLGKRIIGAEIIRTLAML